LVLSQAIRLDFDDGTSYRPDFAVVVNGCTVRLIEVKGGYKGPGWEQGVERYRRAKDVFQKWFGFALWTWKNGQWEIT